jgi:hypothetical protein
MLITSVGILLWRDRRKNSRRSITSGLKLDLLKLDLEISGLESLGHRPPVPCFISSSRSRAFFANSLSGYDFKSLS